MSTRYWLQAPGGIRITINARDLAAWLVAFYGPPFLTRSKKSIAISPSGNDFRGIRWSTQDMFGLRFRNGVWRVRGSDGTSVVMGSDSTGPLQELSFSYTEGEPFIRADFRPDFIALDVAAIREQSHRYMCALQRLMTQIPASGRHRGNGGARHVSSSAHGVPGLVGARPTRK